MTRHCLWCFFCGVPLENARAGWLEAVENWYFPKGLLDITPPPAPTKDTVTISEEDGKFWSEVVCVGPTHHCFVSSRGKADCNVQTIAFADHTINYIYENYENPTLIAHPHCLSFLCRRINASPEQIWGSLYAPESDYLQYAQTCSGILDKLEYYDIEEFHNSDDCHYCAYEYVGRKDNLAVYLDPKSMMELQWLLVRPTVLPIVPSLTSSVAFATSPSTSRAHCMDVFNVPELFDIILNLIIGQDTPQAELSKELHSKDIFTPHSVMQSTKDIFVLLQVNKSLYTSILRNRQIIFLRLTWMHGWMLPFTPEDWNNWSNGIFHNGTVFQVEEDQDWRAYLLTFLRKENVHVRNRWRFHKMALQFARGRSNGLDLCWRFEVGELGFRPDVRPDPEPSSWEKERSRC